jgi:hypothetical protein
MTTKPAQRDALTAAEVSAMLTAADVDLSELTISDDPDVWVDVDTGQGGTSVRVDGPKEARRAAGNVLYEARLANAPYPDHDMWTR